MSLSRKPAARPPAAPPHKIRIIGGRFKRTPIPVLDLPGLRPTPDRVRETLFNWLNHFWDGDFAGRRVLDAFAGSGALGLEAASRGAGEVVMIEHDRRAAAALQALCDRLGASGVRIVAGDALRAVPALGGRFDLALLDPPFGHDWLARILPALQPALAADALVYIEAEHAVEPPPWLTLLRQERAGAVYAHLFRSAAI
ncbi:16S rRNA (guanine(966)-N(2))-methyltransferase RsmD [Pigmentiphaga soli]|uniref:16S rRNA (Guanine(966)-N(2))-methyltransferase RsmD n=1 Tax=Pigmentiphaga soli TaxID=1007095 RepID=A0ABP8HQD7_9BURK